MRRRDLLAAGALVLSGAVPARRVAAQDKKVLKASDVHPEGYPTVQAVESLGKKLDQATNGRLTVQMYASMQLGGEKEVIEQAQVGALQFARVSVGTLGPVVDDLNVLNLPFVFRDVSHMRKVV
ncbi:MAG: TRAP transporter substrate-binding protein DctP, partial [Alphaproteobacteria bacterium]|nr:TRAP transporter substrate-binding protein DctP [Alphaproteobacteria bacterium]